MNIKRNIIEIFITIHDNLITVEVDYIRKVGFDAE